MKKKYYYNNPVVVFGWSPREGDESFEWSYTKFSDGTSPEENKEYPLSEVWDKDLVFDGIHRDNVGGTSEIEVHYLDKTALYQEGKFVAYIRDAFKTTNPFKLANGHTEQDQEGNETHYQFDKTKSYLIRRNSCSGPPKIIFIYKNEADVDCYKEVRSTEIGESISAPLESEAGITHYTFGDWEKVKAHYELVGDKYVVDENLAEVTTFPKNVTEFNEYYQAKLVPNNYKLSFATALFYNTSDQSMIAESKINEMFGSWSCKVLDGETIKMSKDGHNTLNSNNFAYKTLVKVEFTLTSSDYTLQSCNVVSANDQQQGTPYNFTLEDSTYTTTFEMPGQDSFIKILFTKNDTTN